MGAIPTRRGISAQTSAEVAKSVVDGLLAGWGMMNAKKIVAAMRKRIKAEQERRKEQL